MILASRSAGQGAPVVLLHGLFGQGRNLGSLQAGLARTHRAITLDLRNHGASPHAAGMDYPSLAADVIETLDALGIDRCALVGHSMGGKVAMRIALEAPARIARLVVADMAPVAYPGEGFAPFAAAMQALSLMPGMSRAAAYLALRPAVPEDAVRGFLLQNLQVGDNPGWRIGLDEIAAGLRDVMDWPVVAAAYEGPALFIGGGRSDYIAPGCNGAIRAQFPNAAFATIADAGHWLHVDKPGEFLAEVAEFLNQATPA